MQLPWVWAVVKEDAFEDEKAPCNGDSRMTCLQLFLPSMSHCLVPVDAGGLQTPEQSLFPSNLIVDVLSNHGNSESS